ncbi:hypothetical protein OAory_01019670 [Aspergillus oryzae]|uniref:Xylanolytic transcriptional activator regulatory domain-containing protein n=1 Tax=Aspergillus oryzae TaxID=5062 RepID=A0A1S9DBL7_ASPOZ|nr:hypothetical protein OAory_01019670 [Aspergillus oryzae]
MDNARRDLRLADLVSQLDLNRPEPVELAQSTDVRPSSTDREAQDRYPADDISNDVDTQFSIDTEGRVSLLVAPYLMPAELALRPIQQHYFGATSRFHPIPGHDHRHDTKAEINEPETQEMENYHRRWLCSNARFQGPWERMAHANMSHYTHVDPNICSSLLDVYWSWQAPLHNCIYRRCFYRDMALGGPYFSRFLLNVVFAHACRHMPEDDPRFSQFERGETFLREAMLLLIDEMQQSKPQIPTIQGLLILGGRQCAVGKSSEGWLYTGMRHPLALRAQIVCTEQAAGVNDLFRAYGRLFNFQYQSYLVSYCVYTAATIDVRLARHEDKAIAEMATGRLAITLRMLETEVKQTPGIRRSIEIIRSQIAAPLASNLQRQARRSSEVPDRGPSNREKATGIPLQSVIDTLPQMVSPPPTMSNTSIYGSSTECVATGPSQLPLLEMSGIVVNPNLSLESGWPDWYMNDFGGGFVPDVA